MKNFDTEILRADDILGYKVKPAYKDKHGYAEYKYKFLPGVIGGSVGAVALIAAAGIITAVVKKKKKSK